MNEAKNRYVCFYRNMRCEVQAHTEYEAKQKAIDDFRAGKRIPKRYDIHVVLAEQENDRAT